MNADKAPSKRGCMASPAPGDDPTRPFHCTPCGKSFKTRRNLHRHAQRCSESAIAVQNKVANDAVLEISTSTAQPSRRPSRTQDVSSRLKRGLTEEEQHSSARLSTNSSSAISLLSLPDPASSLKHEISSVGERSCVFGLAAEANLPAHLVFQCIDEYFQYLHAVCPMIHQEDLRGRLTLPGELSWDQKVLVLSLCAFVTLRTPARARSASTDKAYSGAHLVHTCLQLIKSFGSTMPQSLASVQASYLLSMCYSELQQPKSHGFYLQEAISMACALGLHLGITYSQMDQIQSMCGKITFALLFIAERRYALLRNRPTSIATAPQLPYGYCPEEYSNVLLGIQMTSLLFLPVDQTFVTFRHLVRLRSKPSKLPDYVAQLQHGLETTGIDDTDLRESQKVDILVTRHWLCLVVWQFSLQNALLSSLATEAKFQFTFPIQIADDLCRALPTLSAHSVLINGLTLFEEVFEITFTLMDALRIAKVRWSDSSDLQYLLGWFSISPNAKKYHTILESRLNEEVNERAPWQSSPAGIEQVIPDTSVDTSPITASHRIAQLKEADS